MQIFHNESDLSAIYYTYLYTRYVHAIFLYKEKIIYNIHTYILDIYIIFHNESDLSGADIP